MAKQKVKKVPFEKEATEVRPGMWVWEVGGIKWWFDTTLGLNTGVLINGRYEPRLSCKTIEHAAMFAEGWSGGYAQGEKDHAYSPDNQR